MDNQSAGGQPIPAAQLLRKLNAEWVAARRILGCCKTSVLSTVWD